MTEQPDGRKGQAWPKHGFVPDPLVTNDTSPCEICGGRYRDRVHTGYAGYVRETDRVVVALEAQVEALTRERDNVIRVRDRIIEEAARVEAEVTALRGKAALADDAWRDLMLGDNDTAHNWLERYDALSTAEASPKPMTIKEEWECFQDPANMGTWIVTKKNRLGPQVEPFFNVKYHYQADELVALLNATATEASPDE